MRASLNVTQLLQTMVHARMSCTWRASFLRRHERQMEQRYGPAWRYVAPSAVAALRQEECEAETAEVPTAVCGGCEETGGDAVVAAVSSSSSSSSRGTTPPTPFFRSKSNVRAKAVQLGLVSEHDDVTFSLATGEGPSPSQDPLLEFLERHEEDAALLLAMWTSLRRSCLHASEISESLSLGARWCLHRLIHMRAFAAAVRFYHRLLELGVQLQKWDVVVLLSNLPYERSATVAASQSDVWMGGGGGGGGGGQSSSHWTVRQAWERRHSARRERGREKSSSSRAPLRHTNDNTACCVTSGVKRCRASEMDTSMPPLVSTRLGPLQPFNEVAHDPSASVAGTKHDLRKPDWIRRWVLYEASMGNMDVLDDEGFLTTTSMNFFSPTAYEVAVVDENTSPASCEAERIIAVTALLNHLLLLHDTRNMLVVKEHTGGKQQHSSIKVRRPPSSSARQRRHWVEALCLAGMYLQSRRTSHCGGSLLPDGFVRAVQGAVSRSGSWVVSFRYLHSAERHGMTLSKRECEKFLLMAAEAEPWRKSSHVERFVARHVMPFFSDETAAGYAAKSLWLLHVCSVKPDRPGDYMELMGERADNLTAAVRQCMVYTKLAASHLRIEVDRYRAEVEASKLRATSVRLGLFSQDMETTKPKEENAGATVAVGGDPDGGTLNSSVSGALLSDVLKDSFMLLCIGIPRVVSLASVIAVSQDDVIQLAALLVDTVYSHTGVWRIFSDLYRTSGGNIPARPVPERLMIAVTVALCVVRISLTLFEAHGHLLPPQRGVPVLTAKQLTLLLGIIAEALSSVSAHELGMIEVQQQVGELLCGTARLAKGVIRFMNLFPTAEKMIFGCTSENAVESVTLIVRVLLLLLQRTNSPWRRLPASTRMLLQPLLRPACTLGKQVRCHLQQKEVEQLNRLLYRRADLRGSGRLCKGGISGLSSSSSSVQLCVHAPEDVARIEATANMHKTVYFTVVSHENNRREVERELTTRLRSMRWDDALLLVHVALHQLRLTPGTFSPAFFAEVLERLRHGWEANARRRRRAVPLWLKAVTIYWDAVGHTAGRSLCGTTLGTATEKEWLQRREREVLSVLLLPLVRLSMLLRRRDLGFAWLARWSSMHPSRDRDILWKMMNIRARAALCERRALQMCVKLYHTLRQETHEPTSLEPASMELLLCEVAVQHTDWCVAIECLLDTVWPASKDRCATAPLSPVVARSALRILCRAPINLSNTALRLRSVQGDCWDLQSACGLLLLLVRHRRWKLALEHVAEMLPLLAKPEGSVGKMNIADKDTGKTKMAQAFFLLHGLRACANGGRSEEAAVLYDSLKALLMESRTVHTMKNAVVESNGDVKHVEDLLLSMCDGDGGPPELAAEKWDEQLRIVAGQARLYFFRAMTKKSLVGRRQMG